MTWASRSFSGTVSRTREFLSRRLWAWPIIAFFLLLAVGLSVNGAIERTMVTNTESELETLLKVEVEWLRTWLAAQENNAASVSGDTDVRRLTETLLAAYAETGAGSDKTTETIEQLVRQLGPAMNSHDYESFFLADRTKILASSKDHFIGFVLPRESKPMFDAVFEGVTTVTPPLASKLPLVDRNGVRRTGVPVMFAVAPVLDENLQVVAALGLQIRPEKEFTRILQLGRVGDSGETYAFDKDGLMLSNSRFDNDLILLGLIPDKPGSRSILDLLIRDPGGNMTQGFRPSVRRGELPPTKMIESATTVGAGTDVAGYRDYRGVKVVGSWTWMEDYGFGVATEVDFAEAFRPLTILKYAFWGLLTLLALSSIAIFVFTIIVARLQRQAREAAIEAKQLGQYKLEEKLGEGTMGAVYRGRHAMLRRPTAIKLIDVEKVTETSISRFEREVQTTSNLNHPNTIAIYDYGRTPEGVFYYAMEYLDGIDLQTLIETYGPQPAGRVIYILKQMCGSLYEAHTMGLVHRDIKPANTMLNRRGGEGDVVKVLDFGLVKARDEPGEDHNDESIAGTPLYMSPEAFQMPGSVDTCSDIYSVGAVGYFLLAGRPVFNAESLVELSMQHASETPKPPSSHPGVTAAPDLENAILKCLEKTRSKRPQTARDLANLLNRCATAADWSADDADAWWDRHERGQSASEASRTATGKYDATIAYDG